MLIDTINKLSRCNPNARTVVITTFFNPLGFRSRQCNLKLFIEGMKKQGIPVLLPYISYSLYPLPQSPYCFPIQLHSDAVLWHKEALLNLVIAALPEHITNVVICDADVIFEDRDWPEKVDLALRSYDLIQPFSYVVRMGPEQLNAARNLPKGRGLNRELISYSCQKFGLTGGRVDKLLDLGTKGYCWAARKEYLLQHPLYDRLIVGGGDELNALAWLGELSEDHLKLYGADLAADILTWHKKNFTAARTPKIGFLPGRILHLWHGDLERRQYQERYSKSDIIASFNPQTDLNQVDGLYEFAEPEGALSQYCANYFRDRREDDSSGFALLRSYSNLRDAIYNRLNK